MKLDEDRGNPRTAILRQAKLQAAVRNYCSKSGDRSECDFGAISFFDHKLFLKIDAYDRDLEHG